MRKPMAANIQLREDETIAKYPRTAAGSARKSAYNDIDIGMSSLGATQDQHQRGLVDRKR